MMTFRCLLSAASQSVLGVILKYAGTMAPMAPILLVVGGEKAQLAQALVLCDVVGASGC